MNNRKVYHYSWWFIWLAVIFIFSSIPELTVVEESSWDLILRNLGHALIFGILFILSLRLALTENLSYPFVWALIFTISYAVLDELHQTYITGRVGDLGDVFVDSIGVLAFFLLAQQSTFRKIVFKV